MFYKNSSDYKITLGSYAGEKAVLCIKPYAEYKNNRFAFLQLLVKEKFLQFPSALVCDGCRNVISLMKIEDIPLHDMKCTKCNKNFYFVKWME